MSVIIISVAVAAVVAGLLGNRWLRRGNPDGPEGPSVSDILTQAITLAVLFMAFVLVEASASYSVARQAATAEADAVDTMFEAAEYAPEPYRQNVTGKLVCYSRAITQFEWPNMGKGYAPEANVWSTALRADFKELYDSQAPIFDRLVDADDQRAASRRVRFEESKPTTPAPVYGLMMIALVISIAGYLMALGRIHLRAKIFVTILLALLLTSALLLVRDLERPFSGVTAIGSGAMDGVQTDITGDYVARYGMSLPCDGAGRPG